MFAVVFGPRLDHGEVALRLGHAQQRHAAVVMGAPERRQPLARRRERALERRAPGNRGGARQVLAVGKVAQHRQRPPG